MSKRGRCFPVEILFHVFVHRNLPERLRALTPRERAMDRDLQAVLEKKLATEKVTLKVRL